MPNPSPAAAPLSAEALDLRLQVACAAVREAGALARLRFRNRPVDEVAVFKGHQDYLSAVDREVELLVRDRLLRSFPEDGFFGEEGGGSFEGPVWVVDPIDGTGNFVRGLPGFCISIGYVRDGAVQVGALYDPLMDELFAARRGGGATLDGRPIRVSGVGDLDRATVEAGWSTRLPLSRYVALLGRLTEAGAGIRRAGSGALGLAYVAAGRIDAYCELHINSWDAVAGLLLIEEAGGWTNDFLAGSGLTEGAPVLGCTPEIRAALCALTGIGSDDRHG
ncbi:inositol monophosphatase family protein [Salinarimonas soli]|uniref:Inositol-1-monophosphatase n=1 Tax=Salinarimonas soli TaxID=1638099 RepID=A0A5B2V8K7_9HYPH|nr:inositol monophosphatase family protein [Salinarimonas soli]KAA2234659.1 inositol monophosphatase [Salinarimonas soli]